MKNVFKKQLLISGSVILGSIIAASVGLYFLSGDLGTQAQKIITEKALAAQQASVLGILAQLESDAPVAAKYSAAIDQLLPIHDDLIGVPGWVNGLAAKHDVTASFSFQGNNNPATNATPGTDGFTVLVEGQQANVAAFLNDMESQSPQFLLNVNSLDLVNNGPDYKLSIQGVLFSRLSAS